MCAICPQLSLFQWKRVKHLPSFGTFQGTWVNMHRIKLHGHNPKYTYWRWHSSMVAISFPSSLLSSHMCLYNAQVTGFQESPSTWTIRRSVVQHVLHMQKVPDSWHFLIGLGKTLCKHCWTRWTNGPTLQRQLPMFLNFYTLLGVLLGDNCVIPKYV